MSDEEIHDCAVAGKVPRFHVPELLPLLLLGITDDCLDVATSTYEKLEGIGEIYKKVIDQLEVSRRETDAGKNSTPAYNNIPTQDSNSSKQITDGNLETSGEETKLGENHQVLEDTKHAVGEPERDYEEEEEHTAKDAMSTTETCFKAYYTHPSPSLMSQNWRKEDNLTERPALSAEKILDTDLRLFNECQNQHEKAPGFDSDEFFVAPHTSSCGPQCHDVPKGSQPKVEYEQLSEAPAQLETESGIEDVKSNEESTMAGEKKGVNGLHILANEVR